MPDRRGGTRQRKHWHLVGDVLQSFTANSTAILGSFTASGGDPFTVLRLVGELAVTAGAAGVVAGDAAVIAVGIGVVSADALAVGASAMPDPGGEPDFNWLWWYQAQMMYPIQAQVGGPTEGARIRIESKAMRKVAPRQSLVMIGQYIDLGGGPPIDVLGSARVLVGE